MPASKCTTKSPQTPYSDGTTQVAFDSLDFLARLTALVPVPKVNLTRLYELAFELEAAQPWAAHWPPLTASE